MPEHSDFRITGGDITDLIERSKVDFLGHVGIVEECRNSKEYEESEKGVYYELIRGHPHENIELALTKEDFDRVYDANSSMYLPLTFLQDVMRRNGIFLARANLVHTYAEYNDTEGYYFNDESEGLRELGFGDLYRLKSTQEI